MLGQCTKCGSKSGRSKWCTGCKNEWARNNKDRVDAQKRAYTARFVQKRDELKNQPCADCGRRYHPRLMDFDHLVVGSKTRVIGRMRANVQALVEEIAKCELVCVMCHRARTQLRRDASRKPRRLGDGSIHRRQVYISKAKTGPCALCSLSFPSWQMDLDHLHSKVIDLAAAARKLTLEEIDTEIKKCRLLCALCHRAHTFGVDPAPITGP